MSWFRRAAREREQGSARHDFAPDLKLEQLQRAVRDFPGRGEADLARILYGRAEEGLVADDARRLEAAALLTRDPEGGGLYPARR